MNSIQNSASNILRIPTKGRMNQQKQFGFLNKKASNDEETLRKARNMPNFERFNGLRVDNSKILQIAEAPMINFKKDVKCSIVQRSDNMQTENSAMSYKLQSRAGSSRYSESPLNHKLSNLAILGNLFNLDI